MSFIQMAETEGVLVFAADGIRAASVMVGSTGCLTLLLRFFQASFSLQKVYGIA